MIVFHEGLPGAGKSYEAMATRIVPALKAGRRVVAYIEGLDVPKIAAVSELTPERVGELLRQVTREQCEGDGILELAEENALIVLDEAQNFWGNREKLSKRLTQFVTEHRHQGIDLVLMGQDLRDVHTLWRRRVDIKACFLKLSALGTSKRYSVTTHRHLGADKFEKVGTKVMSYDPKYFGTYASHTSSLINTEDYKDKRATVWSGALFTFGIPASILAGAVGFWYAWGFFHPAPPKPRQAVVAPAGGVATGQVLATPQPVAPVAPVPAKDVRSIQERYFAELSTKARVRLAGLVVMGKRVAGVVEWVEGSRVTERMTLDELRNLGAAVVASEGTVRLALGEWCGMATMWPTMDDSLGRVSQAELALAKGGSSAPVYAGATSLGGSVAVAPAQAQKPADVAPPVTVVVRKPS